MTKLDNDNNIMAVPQSADCNIGNLDAINDNSFIQLLDQNYDKKSLEDTRFSLKA